MKQVLYHSQLLRITEVVSSPNGQHGSCNQSIASSLIELPVAINNVHKFQLELANFDVNFFYGLISYVHRYDAFKRAVYSCFVNMMSNVQHPLESTMIIHVSAKGTLIVRITPQFLNKYLQHNSLYLKHSSPVSSSSESMRKLYVIGTYLRENDIIIRAWYDMFTFFLRLFQFFSLLTVELLY